MGSGCQEAICFTVITQHELEVIFLATTLPPEPGSSNCWVGAAWCTQDSGPKRGSTSSSMTHGTAPRGGHRCAARTPRPRNTRCPAARSAAHGGLLGGLLGVATPHRPGSECSGAQVCPRAPCGLRGSCVRALPQLTLALCPLLPPPCPTIEADPVFWVPKSLSASASRETNLSGWERERKR